MSRRRKRGKSKRLAYGVIAVVIFLCFLAYLSVHQPSEPPGNYATPPQAAIVDQLNFTGQSDPTFVNACETILNEGGLTWTYYKGEDVTVNFYRNLPSCATSLIILRVHSAIMKTPEGIVSLLGLFTSELYSPPAAQKYSEDVTDGRLVEAFFNETQLKEGISYFGIVPSFIEKSMNGEFKNTTIIMMGCEGLGYINTTGARVPYTDMAEAFINKGAKVYIGWDGTVSVNYTDQATLDLLQSLILKKQKINEAVEEVNADPSYKSVLKFYPDEAGDYVVLNLKSSLSMNVTILYTTPRTSKRFKYN
jgi:hypothetical protein